MPAAKFDRAEILRTWQIFNPNGHVVEVRVPKAGKYKKQTFSGYFDNAQWFADCVLGLEDEKFQGIYFTLNPMNPALLARCANKIDKSSTTTTNDKDIVHLDWLPIDLDAKRPSEISANEAEHEAALQTARKIRDYLTEQGWPFPVYADSGNGGHLVYRIDLDKDSKLVEKFLKVLDAKFSDETVKVDTGIGNPARIFKLYGTPARKGSNTADRPHRLAQMIEMYPKNWISSPRGN